MRSRHANIRRAAYRPAPPRRVVATHPAHHPPTNQPRISPSLPRCSIIHCRMSTSRALHVAYAISLRLALDPPTRPRFRQRSEQGGDRPTPKHDPETNPQHGHTTAMPYSHLTGPFHIRSVGGRCGVRTSACGGSWGRRRPRWRVGVAPGPSAWWTHHRWAGSVAIRTRSSASMSVSCCSGSRPAGFRSRVGSDLSIRVGRCAVRGPAIPV
jgi:hypothetical protein